MRRHASRVERWELYRRSAACCLVGVCILIASTARGQENVNSSLQVPSVEQAIRQALQVKSDFDFKETPLPEVVKSFKNLTKLEIILDKKALDEIGIAADTPVTFSAHGISARSALDLLLHEHGLARVIRDGVLMVTTPEEADNMLETRVYPVLDLVTPKPSYRFEGMYIPGMSVGGFPRTLPARSADGGGSNATGEMGSTSGGMGGGMGMFRVSDEPKPAEGKSGGGAASASPPQPNQGVGGMGVPNRPDASRGKQSRDSDLSFTMSDLIDLIKTCVDPTAWDDAGGVGSAEPAAGMLVVTQTEVVHEKIEKFLENLRASSPGMHVVTIRATWLLLDLKQLNLLLNSRPGKESGIDRKALEEMAAKCKGYLGAISCFSGQTVHIASGRNRSAVTGAIPVVGGGGEDPGYQPIINNLHSGAMLQVTPQLLPNTQAVLDICTSVTCSDVPAESIRFLASESAGTGKPGEGKSHAARGHTAITLDRVNMVVGQLATTLKVQLGEPTLVGGLTRESSTDQQQAADTPQLYLFIEATAR